MNSIQLIRFLDALAITEYRVASGVIPKSIVIKGRDFTAVEMVSINGLPSPNFVVVDTYTVLAEVPTAVTNTSISSVAVLGSSLTFGETSLVEFTFGYRPRSITGKARMLQAFLRVLMRTPGTNIFHKEVGGGLLGIIGGQFDDHGQLTGALTAAVRRAQRSLIRAQTPETSIPASERLLSASLVAASVDPLTNDIAARVKLTSHDGEESGATIIT